MNTTTTSSPEASILEATGQLREIPQHPGYFVTRNGSVYSLRRSVFSLLSQIPIEGGYLKVNLDGRRRRVHQLVLEAWVGPRPEGQEARHLDGVPTHNVVGNLAWGTSSENKLDQVRLGTHRNARKSVCSQGHDFAEHGYRRSNGTRRCRPCHATNERARYVSQKSA
jgi:hypothetical protein